MVADSALGVEIPQLRNEIGLSGHAQSKLDTGLPL